MPAQNGKKSKDKKISRILTAIKKKWMYGKRRRLRTGTLGRSTMRRAPATRAADDMFFNLMDDSG